MNEKQNNIRKHRKKLKVNNISTFLRHKRAKSFLKAKDKSKIKNWTKHMEKIEENIDFDIVRDNFNHFFHLNFENMAFNKELQNLERMFTSKVYWYLIENSYFQDRYLKEKIDNLKNEINKEDISNDEEIKYIIYRNGYKYNSLFKDLQETKIKSDIFDNIRDIINYDKDDKKSKNNLDNDLKDFKEIVNVFREKIHKINERRIERLNEKINKTSIEKRNNYLNNKNSIIKINPLFEQSEESLEISNRFIQYLKKRENIQSIKNEKSEKIFSFYEKLKCLNDNDLETTEGQEEREKKLKSYKAQKYLNKNNILNQNICCVCNNGDVEQNQFLLRCEHCGVTVHQNCYGVQGKDLYNWICDPCKSRNMSLDDVYNLECFLCPVKGGAFKRVELPIESTFYKNIMDYKHNKIEIPKDNFKIIIPKDDFHQVPLAWVHLSCALWNPKINLKDYEKKSGIYIENIVYEDFNSFCELCKKDNCGPTIKCNNELCNSLFHPECARLNNCCLEVEIINKEFQYNVYCYKHKPNFLSKKINLNCQDEIQQVVLVNQKLESLYDLYKNLYKTEIYQRAKPIKKIQICPLNIKKIRKSIGFMRETKQLKNIVINIKKEKKLFHVSSNNSDSAILNKKRKKSRIKGKSLKTIKIKNYNIKNSNISQTIINNIGSGNNINIYVNNYNYNNSTTFSINSNQIEEEEGKKSKYISPSIEIKQKDFDNISDNAIQNLNNCKYIENKIDFIIYLIGFMNDYTLNNRIILNKKGQNYIIDKKLPIYFLKYEDFQKGDIPWEFIGYKNLPSSLIRKSFFELFPEKKQYEELFLKKIDKILKELKKNKVCKNINIDCDNKEHCVGSKNGSYKLLSLNEFKYKIIDEKHIYPKKYICPSCINNIPRNKHNFSIQIKEDK